ncbi:MAG: sigma 54-interacting transcriptional regulator [Phycisphaerae bacterium]|nr:sigma 54-interacting transcriptional regulator [Phycisphaerae bacterium]
MTGAHAALSADRILESTVEGVFVLDRELRFVYFNAGCERITGYSRADVLGSICGCGEIVECHDRHERSLTGALCPAKHLLHRDSSTTIRQEMRVTRKDGTTVWIETDYSPLFDRDGKPELIIGVMRDVSDRRAQEDELIATAASLRNEVEQLREQLRGRFGFDDFISRSPKMQAIYEKMRAAIASPFPVLISGPPGCGQEAIAQAIHRHGRQKDGPFVVLHAGVLAPDRVAAALEWRPANDGEAPSLLAAAGGGTLFIDEICSMPPAAQVRLVDGLRDAADGLLRDPGGRARPVRLIAATARDLLDAVSTNALRRDLYYRLNVVPIEVPPLRERREDIPFLVRLQLDRLAAAAGIEVLQISPRAMHLLTNHDWPGNVDELNSVLESAFAARRGPIVQASDLPGSIRGDGPPAPGAPPASTEPLQLDAVLARVERDAILNALRRADGQRNKAARLLGVSRSRLYRRMEALGILSNEPKENA